MSRKLRALALPVALLLALFFTAVPVAPVAAETAQVESGKVDSSKAHVGKPTLATLDLKDGDTLVFAGDSITHQCLYTQYVENFFYTRYPDRKIRFHNAGISGDKARDVLNRFDFDVAAFKPKVVTVLLGMNDGGYKGMEQTLLDTYVKDMNELLDDIARLKASAVVMSPTMFDQQQYRVRGMDPKFRFNRLNASPYYNSVMAFYGAWLREAAMRRGLGYVNMWSPLNDLTIEKRREDPSFTFIKDAIHPDAPGQAIMAFAIINDVRPDRTHTSTLNAVRARGKWRVTTGKTGEATDVQGDEAGVSFTFTARSLPWVLPEEARLGYVVSKAGHKLSAERVRIAGLKPGSYQVRIDGKPIAAGKKFSHVQLGAKIELQSIADTPQYQQALKVAMLNKERNEKAVRPYRNLIARFKGTLRKSNGDRKAAMEAMAKMQPKLDELKKLAADYEAKIYAAAKPVPRKYEVAPVE